MNRYTLCASLSLCVSCFVSPIRRFFNITELCVIFRIDDLLTNKKQIPLLTTFLDTTKSWYCQKTNIKRRYEVWYLQTNIIRSGVESYVDGLCHHLTYNTHF